MTLVGVGHALADAFAFVDEDVPQTLGLHPGTFSQVPDYRMRAILATMRQKSLMAGGSAANTVKLAARLGVDAHFVGQCGHDEAGQIFESELLQAGVKVNLARIDAPTGLCVTFLSPALGRTVATFRSASGDLPVGLLGATLRSEADFIVVEGYLLDEAEFLDELMARCAAENKAVVLDIAQGALSDSHRQDLVRHLGSEVVRYLFLPETEAALIAPRPETTVVLKGETSWRVQSRGKTVAIARDESTVVDDTGVDDAFAAGFLWAVGQGWAAADAGNAGALVATCVAEQPGTKIDDTRWERLIMDLRTLSGS